MSNVCRVLYVTGPVYNDIARSWAVIANGLGGSSKYPLSNICDGDTTNPGMFSDASANPVIPIDKNLIANGDMTLNDGSGNLTWWDVSGTVAYNATDGPTGGPAAVFTGGGSLLSDAGDGTIHFRPGETCDIEAQLYGDGTNPMLVTVQNALDLTYLNSSGVWQTAAANVFSQTAATWASFTLQFSLPSYVAEAWPILGYLPLIITVHTVGDGRATNVFCWPYTNLASFHFYDQQPQLSVLLQRGGTGYTPSYSTYATLAPVRPAFFWVTPSGLLNDRWLQIKLAGTPSIAPWFGEIVLSQYREAVTAFNFGGTVTRLLDQVRSMPAFGAQRARAVAELERRTWKAKFSDLSQAGLDDHIENLMRQSGYGQYPVVWIPQDDAPIVLHAQLPESTEPTWIAWNRYDRELVLVEDPGPTLVA